MQSNVICIFLRGNCQKATRLSELQKIQSRPYPEYSEKRQVQARNFMRDDMKPGDGVVFYHSSCAEPGIVGMAEVASTPYPDPTQFDAKSHYNDPKSKPDEPRWQLVDVKVLRKTRNLTLPELRANPALEDLVILRKGNRLSITPVEPRHWRAIVQLLA